MFMAMLQQPLEAASSCDTSIPVSNYIEQARTARNNEDYETAIELYNCTLQIDPLAEDAYLALIGAYLELGDYNSVNNQLLRVSEFSDLPLELEPLIRSSMLFEQGMYAEALHFSIEATELNPASPVGYIATGYIYSRQGQYATALAYIDRAIEIFPDSSDSFNLFYERGYVYYQLGNTDLAKADFDQAQTLEPAIVIMTLEDMLRYSRLGLEDALSSSIERLYIFNLVTSAED
jgi:tetratricopeptide (TPR) repeat protein